MSQTRETPLPYEVPTWPWQTLGTDLFEFEEENYLIIVDYYSKFPLEKMPAHCTAKAFVRATKKLFSEQENPQKVVSDNGHRRRIALSLAQLKIASVQYTSGI